LLCKSESQGAKTQLKRKLAQETGIPDLGTVAYKGSNNILGNLSPFLGSPFLDICPVLRQALTMQ
jgi:hypothetical protein